MIMFVLVRSQILITLSLSSEILEYYSTMLNYILSKDFKKTLSVRNFSINLKFNSYFFSAKIFFVLDICIHKNVAQFY